MKKLIILCAIALVVLLLVAPVVGCKQEPSQETNIVEVIRIFKTESPDYPPPPGGWISMSTGPHPSRIQEVFDLGDKMFLGLVISEQIANEVKFSRFTFFNKGTGTEEEIIASPDDLGPFEPGRGFLTGFQNPWEVPDENGEYELRLYIGNEVVASALFNVGVWPASWGPEKVKRLAPIYEVRVITGQEEPRVDVAVYIKGGLPQGCEASHGCSVEQVVGDTIYIKAFIIHLKGMPCEDYIYFEETVNLWPRLLRDFTPGETYTVNVNDYTTTFVMP